MQGFKPLCKADEFQRL